MVGSSRRDIGLGGYPGVTLATARAEAREIRAKVRSGIDPVVERKDAILALKALQAKTRTFREVAHEVHSIKVLEFKNRKHADQWINTLETYAFPTLGDRTIAGITTDDVMVVLKDIWLTKNETARRVQQRMNAVFEYAIRGGFGASPSPASWSESLKGRLPAPSKLAKKAGGKKNHARVNIDHTPAFMSDLLKRHSVSTHALAFAVLTAARSGEVRGARWDEIDFSRRHWTIPADRMKAGEEHRVPLSNEAIELLHSCNRQSILIFPGQRGQPLSDNTLSKLMKDMHAESIAKGGIGYLDEKSKRIATPHGTARSSFQDWSLRSDSYLLPSGDRVSFPKEWSEAALAHCKDDYDGAYSRDKALEERRILMQAWADFLTGKK